jgi:soluble lytic murein transglycosylase
MTSQRRPLHLIGLVAAAALMAASGGAVAEKARKNAKTDKPASKQADVPLPRPHPARTVRMEGPAAQKGGHLLAPTPILPTGTFATATVVPTAVAPPLPRLVPAAPFAAAATTSTSAADIALVKRAFDLVRERETSKAVAVQKTIEDPLARKLVEWAILRSDDHEANFDRFVGFISANPSWPSVGMMRKRAEAGLWDEKRDPAAVRAFFGAGKPTTAKGRFALARALMAQGDRAGAAQYAREAWRGDTLSNDLQRQAEETFGEFLTRADHKARMERLFYAGENEDAMRIAKRLGGVDLVIANARNAVVDRTAKAGALLDAVPESARHDAGYIFARAQWLRRQEKWAEAGRVLLTAPRDPALQVNLDEWWTERRLIARGLLDTGDAATAYRIAADAAPPPKDNNRAEHEFTAGWIALRFLKNPNAAYQHFSRVGEGTIHPTTLARAEYWQGRAAEAAGRSRDARAHYETAARYQTAYYGQIARAKLGMGEFAVRRPPEPSNKSALMNLEVVRAVQILYAIDARDLVIPFATDLAENAVDVGALAVVAEIAQKYNDARAMLYLGKAALARGFAFDVYAFPTNGLPDYRAVGPPVDPSVVYSIARQESAFNPRAVSPAKAMGLMQVLPGTAKMVAKKFGLAFDAKRLLSDPAYNAQIGTAELGDRLQDYRGSYILTFCAYNAGPGRVKQWVNRYGDPRDAEADPIDWVERIPIAETRNYVQRVIENMQVYRAQFGNGARLMIEADLRRGGVAN